jgi:hypothetical protein
MEQTECSETSAHKIQTPGNYPEENIQHKRTMFYCIQIHLLPKFHLGVPIKEKVTDNINDTKSSFFFGE